VVGCLGLELSEVSSLTVIQSFILLPTPPTWPLNPLVHTYPLAHPTSLTKRHALTRPSPPKIDGSLASFSPSLCSLRHWQCQQASRGQGALISPLKTDTARSIPALVGLPSFAHLLPLISPSPQAILAAGSSGIEVTSQALDDRKPPRLLPLPPPALISDLSFA
jgi:hypothetical protein